MPAPDIPGFRGRFLQAALSSRFEGTKGYVLAAIAVLIALLLRMALQDLLEDRAIFILFIPSILVASIAGGIGPGLTAVCLR
jgi:two-component system sensor kinase FixL